MLCHHDKPRYLSIMSSQFCSVLYGDLVVLAPTWRDIGCFSVSGLTCETHCCWLITDTWIFKTMLFYRAYETLSQQLGDSLGCKHCCINTDVLSYFLNSYLHLERVISATSTITCKTIQLLNATEVRSVSNDRTFTKCITFVPETLIHSLTHSLTHSCLF